MINMRNRVISTILLDIKLTDSGAGAARLWELT